MWPLWSQIHSTTSVIQYFTHLHLLDMHACTWNTYQNKQHFRNIPKDKRFSKVNLHASSTTLYHAFEISCRAICNKTNIICKSFTMSMLSFPTDTAPRLIKAEVTRTPQQVVKQASQGLRNTEGFSWWVPTGPTFSSLSIQVQQSLVRALSCHFFKDIAFKTQRGAVMCWGNSWRCLFPCQGFCS